MNTARFVFLNLPEYIVRYFVHRTYRILFCADNGRQCIGEIPRDGTIKIENDNNTIVRYCGEGYKSTTILIYIVYNNTMTHFPSRVIAFEFHFRRAVIREK